MEIWNNPAFRRLVPARRFPSIPLTILIAIGLSVIMAAPARYTIRTLTNTLPLFFGIVDRLVLLGMMVLPGLAAVILVTRDLSGGGTPPDGVNGLTRRERTWGYVLAVLYRLRLLLAAIVAVSVADIVFNYEALRNLAAERCLLPAHLSEEEKQAYELMHEYDRTYDTDDDLSAVITLLNRHGLQCVEPSDPRLVDWALSDILTQAGLWSMALLGVITGVWLAVEPGWAGGLPPMMILLLLCGLLGLIFATLMGPVIPPCAGPLEPYPSCDIVWALLPNHVTNMCAIFIPLALGNLFALSRKRPAA